MFLTNRTFLLLFLIMLQFFAPLLHAHAGKQYPHFGMHIPGLESYFSAPGGLLVLQTEFCLSNTEDFIVAVNDGIQENRSLTDEDTHSDCCLPLLNVMISAAADSVLIKDSPHPPLLPSRIRPLPLLPRAPPGI